MKAQLRSAGESTAFLVAREEYRAELRISWFRTIFMSLFLGLHALLMVSGLTESVKVLAVSGAILLVSIFMLADIWWLGRSRFFSRLYRPGHKYLIITLDALGIAALLGVMLTDPGIRALTGSYSSDPALMLVYLYLAIFSAYLLLDILRFSVGSSYYILVLFTAGLAADLLVLETAAGAAMAGPLRALPFALVAKILAFLIPAAGMTVLSAHVSRRIAHLVIQNKIQQQLERYLPPALTRDSLSRQEVALDQHIGRRGQAAILFADIRGFTALSEQMNPQEVVDFLNVFFNDMIEVVFSHGGTLDKIVGDEIMALFGTPVPSRDYCDQALLAALDMIEKLDAFNELRRLQGQDPVGLGIGIHEGEVVFGSIGSHRRMDFTAIGDAVNTASRLERITRKLNHDIVISEDLYERLSRNLKRSLSFQDFGPARIPGKQKSFRIYGIERR